MFNSTILEIGIGLIFTYLLLGLVVTAANELIATVFRSRARDLRRGIGNLLDGNSYYPKRLWRRILPSGPTPPSSEWADKFFAHPLVNALSKSDKAPSYVPSHVFATVLLHLARQQTSTQTNSPNPGDATPLNGLASFDQIRATVASITNEQVRDALLPLVEAARTDLTDGVAAITKFNEQVEVWFDHSMDRVSGWYKRRTQCFLLGIALLATVLLNVDSIAICRELARNDALRSAVVESAKQYTAADAQRPASDSVSASATTQPATSQPATTQPSVDESFKRLKQQIKELNELGPPIGWIYSDDPSNDATTKPADTSKPADNDLRHLFDHGWLAVLTKVGGLLLTALAASLGAPFWFDTLNKVISVRSTGKPPEERPKDPKVVLQPQRP